MDFEPQTKRAEKPGSRLGHHMESENLQLCAKSRCVRQGAVDAMVVTVGTSRTRLRRVHGRVSVDLQPSGDDIPSPAPTAAGQQTYAASDTLGAIRHPTLTGGFGEAPPSLGSTGWNLDASGFLLAF